MSIISSSFQPTFCDGSILPHTVVLQITNYWLKSCGQRFYITARLDNRTIGQLANNSNSLLQVCCNFLKSRHRDFKNAT